MEEIHKITIPTPFPIGPVNVYLLTGKPLTIVDAGPNTEEAYEAIVKELEKRGYCVGDLEQIIITHTHHDHFGLVGKLVKESGAKTVLHPKAAPWLANHEQAWSETRDYFIYLNRQAGVPQELIDKIARNGEVMFTMAQSAPVGKILSDGELIRAGSEEWQVVFTPGHSGTCICLYHPEKQLFISGDHLLPHISSNPLLEPPEKTGIKRVPSLPVYLESLKMTSKMDISDVLPGHGDNFTNYREVIAQRFVEHECRLDKVKDLVAQKPRNTYQICQDLFPQIRLGQLFLGLSETFNYLDILVEQGKIKKVEESTQVELFYNEAL